MYVYYYIFRQRSSLPLPVYICPYHTKINKSLVLEWPTFTDVYSFTVSYKCKERGGRCKKKGKCDDKGEQKPYIQF